MPSAELSHRNIKFSGSMPVLANLAHKKHSSGSLTRVKILWELAVGVIIQLGKNIFSNQVEIVHIGFGQFSVDRDNNFINFTCLSKSC